MARQWDPFWIEAIQTQFIPQIKTVVEVLKERLLPNIRPEDIEAEAEKISEEKWEEFMSSPGTGKEDPGDFVNPALNAGISHFGLMMGIRQGLLNLFTVALYHTFEQQAMYFHRKNVLHIDEESDDKLFKLSEFQRRLEELDIRITKFASWPKINGELRRVANAVKHAEGGSAGRLRQIRPDLFRHPLLSSSSLLSSPTYLPVFQPLIGDGLCVSLNDIEDYRDHLVRFWHEFADLLQGNCQP
ncbi:MAG: hypothetical protein OXU79_11200 [Gemmatimonadota bacterium]|nr:hypothetical protein [Gemmatimonadota bacterium]